MLYNRIAYIVFKEIFLFSFTQHMWFQKMKNLFGCVLMYVCTGCGAVKQNTELA